jgi:hypothetical protein
MEHAEDLDVPLRREEVGDPIVAVEQHPYVGALSVAIADLREGQ